MENTKTLIAAVSNGRADIVTMLIADPRVNPAIKNNFCIGIAAERGYTEIVKLLLSHSKVDPSANGNQAIKGAALGHTKTVALLLNDPRVDPDCAFIPAVTYGHAKIVAMLIPRINPILFTTGLMAAAKHNHTYIVKLLLKTHVDPSADNNYVIRRAAEHGNTKVVKMLLADPRVDPTVFSGAVIRYAILSDNIVLIAMLLRDSRIIVNDELCKFAIKHKKIEGAKLLYNHAMLS